mgnify:CR=1 FL=1
MEKSINRVQFHGAINEFNLQVEEREVELKRDGNTKKIKCKTINKIKFTNPSMTLDVNKYDEEGNVIKTDTIGVNYFPVHEKMLDENGNVTDNPQFKALQTIMGYEKGTRVRVDGNFADNSYAKDGEYKENAPFVTVNAYVSSSSKVSEKDSSDGQISGIIRNIRREINSNEEETGRLKVEFYMFDKNMAAFPIELTVESDIADVFEDTYEAGDNAIFNVEVVSRQVGAVKKRGGGSFARRESNMVSGFNVMEISVFSDEAQPEEENELFISVDDISKALKEREIMKEAKIKESKEKEKKQSNNSKSGGLGNRKPNIDSNDSPF